MFFLLDFHWLYGIFKVVWSHWLPYDILKCRYRIFHNLLFWAQCTVSIETIVRETNLFTKIMQAILLQTTTEEMNSNRWRLLKKNYHKVVSCAPLLRTKTLAAGSKWTKKYFFEFLPPFALYLLTGCNFWTFFAFYKSNLWSVGTFCPQTPLT